MRRQGIVGAGGPPLFLWNLLHTDSAAAHRFNLVQAEELTAFLRETLGRSPGDLAPALAAERRRLAAVHRMEANIGASAGFASINAPSLATTATMGLVALPEMRKHGHSDALASGSVAAGGTIGSLIPPSGMFIIYGILTEASIGDMFAAGIVPGILLALFYMVVIAIRCRLDPAAGPAGPRFGWSERVSGLRRTGDVILLFVLVMGGIIWGWFTPTEAGAMGPSVRWSSQASGGA